MKIIIFSDTHLSDHFDSGLYKKLVKVINSADLVIINGDFWEGFGVNFDSFVNSKWQRLFPLLKKKKAIYIYGNHDLKTFSDHKVKLFSIYQTEQLKFKLGEKSFTIQHGHQFTQSWSNKLAKVVPIALVRFIFRPIMKQVKKRSIIGQIYLYFAKKQDLAGHNSMIKIMSKRYSPNQYYICGHTHVPHYNKNSSYINSGRFPSYLVIKANKDCTISLQKLPIQPYEEIFLEAGFRKC